MEKQAQAIKELRETTELAVAKEEILRAFYEEKTANEKSKPKSANWALKENQVRDSIKFNKDFLEFLDKNYKETVNNL